MTRGLHTADPSCWACRHQGGFRAVAAHEMREDAPAPHGGTWYHGTSYAPDGGGLQTNDERGEQTSSWRHWNTDLGTHFTSHHETAREFATRSNPFDPNARIAHASLHMANPANYKSEHDLTDHAFKWARRNGFSDYERGGEYDESPEDHRYLNQHYLSNKGDAEDWLRSHPRRGALTSGFKQHLMDRGHDGILYGNEHEGPQGHQCAIAFRETPVNVHQWEKASPYSPETLQRYKMAGAGGDDYSNLTFEHRVFKDDDPEVVHGTNDASGGVLPGEHRITAFHPDHGKVGHVDFDDSTHPAWTGFPERAIHINMLRVHPDHRRRGVATQIMQHLEETHPDVPIDHGTRTRFGEAWGRVMYGRDSKPKGGSGMRNYNPSTNKWEPTHYEADWTLNGRPWSVKTKRFLKTKLAKLNEPHSRSELIAHAEGLQKLYRTPQEPTTVCGWHANRRGGESWLGADRGSCADCTRNQEGGMARTANILTNPAEFGRHMQGQQHVYDVPNESGQGTYESCAAHVKARQYFDTEQNIFGLQHGLQAHDEAGRPDFQVSNPHKGQCRDCATQLRMNHKKLEDQLRRENPGQAGSGERPRGRSPYSNQERPRWMTPDRSERFQPRLPQSMSVQTPPEGLSFHSEDMETGGSKHPIRTHLRAIHPEHGQVGSLLYYPPKRSNGRILIYNLHVESDQRRQGIGSALMDELQRRHPDAPIDHGDRTNDGASWWSGYTEGKPVRRGRTASSDDYRMRHRPGGPGEDGEDDGTAAPAHAVDRVFPDFYEKPHLYDMHGHGALFGGPHVYRDTVRTLRQARGNPEAPVTMYRSLPPEHAHNGFRQGDWVSIHHDYARGHGFHETDEKEDWPVIKATVPAKHLWNNGDMIDEFGYHGPDVKGEIAFPGGANAAKRLQKNAARDLTCHSCNGTGTEHNPENTRSWDCRTCGGSGTFHAADHWDGPKLTDEQHSILHDDNYSSYGRRALDLAKDPKPGTVVWRGEIRHNDEHGKPPASVGMHWSVKPEQAIFGHIPEDHHAVMWQATIDHPDQTIPRSHPIWSGRYRSMDSEAEVRFKPGTQVHLTGAYTSHERAGHPWPLNSDRTKGNWSFQPLDHHATIEHNRSQDDGLAYQDHFPGLFKNAELDNGAWILYHGTNKENAKKIEQEGFKHGNETNGQHSGQGFYFHEHPQQAAKYGDHIVAVEATPRDFSFHHNPWADPDVDHNNVSESLQRQGFDGHRDPDDGAVVLYHPHQIHYLTHMHQSELGMGKRAGSGLEAGNLPTGYTMEVHEDPKTERWGLPALHVKVHHNGGSSWPHGSNRPVGSLSVHQRADEQGGRRGIPNIYVDPEHQRRGLGTAMYAEVHKRWPEIPIQHSPHQSDDARALNHTLKERFGPDVHLGSRFTPTKRVFTHTCGLDHRLWDADEHLKPEVRKYIMNSVRDMWSQYKDWALWSIVYFAGSEASEWTDVNLEGNNDFDVLIGVDYDGFRKANPQYGNLSNQEITDMFNQGFRSHNGPVTLTIDGKKWGPFDRTTYVNPDSYRIETIKPYAAYNVSDDRWAVKPPHLPHWSLSELPGAVQRVLRAASDYADDVLKLPEPERTQQGAALFEAWHSDRSRAFGPNGEGWYDIANLREKWLDQKGTWAELVDCAHRFKEGLGAAPADWSNNPRVAARTSDYDFGYGHGLVGAQGNLPFIHRKVERHGEEALDNYDRDYMRGHQEGTAEKVRRDTEREENGTHKCPECFGTGRGSWGDHCNECGGGGSISHEQATKTDRLFHVTDNPHFAPNASHVPEDNTLAIEERSRPGLYAAHGNDVSHWTSKGYVRPYVAELHVPHIAHEPGRWGGERFIPAENFHQVKVHRIIPLDAFNAEHWRDKPYTGPDAREMSPEEHAQHKQRALNELRENHGFSDDDIHEISHHWASLTSTGMGMAGPDYEGMTFAHMTGKDYGAHPSQHDHEMIFAKKPDHFGYLGHVRYQHLSDGSIYIHNLEVKPEHQRRGVASALMSELQRRNPGVTIDHGNRSPNGTQWAKDFYGHEGPALNNGREGWTIAPKTRDGQRVSAVTAGYGDYLSGGGLNMTRERLYSQPQHHTGDDWNTPEYPHSVGWVQTDKMLPLRHHDGTQNGRSPEVTHELTEGFRHGEGWLRPLQLNYSAEDHATWLGEGNHRLEAARRAGLSHVPVTIAHVRGGDLPSHYRPAPFPQKVHSYSELKSLRGQSGDTIHPRHILPEEWLKSDDA